MKHRLFFSLLVAFAVSALAANLAFADARLVAQANPPKQPQVTVIKGKDTTRYKRITKHIFDGRTVKGKLNGPASQTMTVRIGPKFKSLLQLRKSFQKELWHTARNL